MQSVPTDDVDVVITFPPETSEATILWYNDLITRKIEGIVLRKTMITLTKGTKTKPNCYAFYLSATEGGYLKGLEMMQVPKPIMEQYGGGKKEFTRREVKYQL